ncbi:MAG: NAD(P)H-dependent oxidoreductase [Hydrogenophaga sp.]|uniref:flavodoxin family protein n=1 Tax=Hydrogenophaga sp. TaxID=1904254 RepID=UPI0027F2AA14|nr:NAD(P)H-dependent oxidoreductase [Hydrogenophaga sp.]
MTSARHVLFLVASTREPGHVGNTEWLARQAAASLPPDTTQTWVHLARAGIPEFIDQRHTVGSYPMPESGSVMRNLLDQTLACTDLVFVAPVYWFSFPATLKAYLDHWSAWLRVPGLEFKAQMSQKRLWLITTNGDRAKAQPMIDSTAMCAKFLEMPLAGVLWGKGGAAEAVKADEGAAENALTFFGHPQQGISGNQVTRSSIVYAYNGYLPVFASWNSGEPYTGKASGTKDIADWSGGFLDGFPHGPFVLVLGDRQTNYLKFDRGLVAEN